jgi:hypothetical protein
MFKISFVVAGYEHDWRAQKRASSIQGLLALPTKKALKDIVFRFIIEYSSLKGFWPLLGNNNRSIFYMRIFER